MPAGCRVLLAASGGGHTGHAVAIAQHLVDRGLPVCFAAAPGDAWTRSRVEAYGPVVVEVPRLLEAGERLASLLTHPDRLARLLGVLPRFPRVDVVVSTGSSHSVAVAAGGMLRGAIIVHVEVTERLASLSTASRVLAGFSALVAAQWPEQKEMLSGLTRRVLLVGPVYEKPRYPPADEGYILVTGGTQGFPELFDAVKRAGFERVVMQTGRVDPDRYRRPGWRVFRFDPDLHRWIAGASLVVSHFGRTVVDAALTYGKPVLVIPNPRWSRARGAGFRDLVLLARRLHVLAAPPSVLRDVEVFRRLVERAKTVRPRRYPNGGGLLARAVELLLDQPSNPSP